LTGSQQGVYAYRKIIDGLKHIYEANYFFIYGDYGFFYSIMGG
jgi:hypothetical protein